MEKPKLRPTVTITTYTASSSSSSLFRNHQQQLQDAATKSEFSSDFFADKFRSQTRDPSGAGRVLMDLSQIKGPTGSIRGHKDVVRRSLEGIKVAHNRRLNFSAIYIPGVSRRSNGAPVQNCSTVTTSSSALINDDTQQQQQLSFQDVVEMYRDEYLARLQDEEQDRCVAYTTSLGVIRRTFDDSKIIKSILDLNLIKYEERDTFLNQEYKYQLRIRLDCFAVPAIFVDGKHIGGLKELETMNENGELLKLMSRFKHHLDFIKMTKAISAVCPCCGNARFIACQSCNGSRKSTIHHFKFNSIALHCIKCDQNDGLVQCPACTDSLEKRNQISHSALDSLLDQNNNNQNEQNACSQLRLAPRGAE